MIVVYLCIVGIVVAVQKVTFRTPKAYLLARKSIAFETQNGTSDEQR